VALTDESKSLASYGVGEKAELRLKDLGRQVPYRYLYLWEYVSFQKNISCRSQGLLGAQIADTAGWTDLYQPPLPQILPLDLGQLYPVRTANVSMQ
jgi:hypothetical protein